MPAPFSRLQLAAALIEYDNDPDDPDAPKKSAQQSAIFAHFRRNPAARPDVRVRHSNHLGVALPTDNGASQDGRGSAMGTRRSRGSRNSLDALRNPFGTDSIYDEEQEEEVESEMEVDLSSWGLDGFIPKEKAKSKGKQKSPAPTLAVVRSRTISGGPNEFGEIPGQSKSLNSLNMRRQSTSSRLELGENASQDPLQQRRRATSQSTIPALNQEEGVPFPPGRSHSPGYDHIGSPKEAHHLPRSQSRASIGSRGLLDGFRDDDDQGLPPEESDNPFALQPPTVTSRFDPKAQPVHARTISHGSLGSRGLLDDFDAASVGSHDSDPRGRPYSVVELLRPKVLVMPSPLQPVGPQASEENKVRDGFQMSRDGPPLPPGARPMSRRLSSNLDNIPVPSHSFLPNSTADLSYSQKIFRNTLMPGASGGDGEGLLPRALEEGEQIQFEAPAIEEDKELTGTNLPKPTGRPAGKLYGKSLIDDLETRKQQMRNKQRVFTGDQRPSMMARNSSARVSTLIDPATLNDPPAPAAGKRTSTFDSLGPQNALGRRNSFKPLLNFDNDKVPQTQATPDRVAKNKSVFGVDTLWEREMVKLREIQEQERIDEEARRKAEEEEARRKMDKEKKKRKKKKGVAEEEEADGGDRLAPEAPAEPRVSIEPPVLPDIIKPTPRRTAPKVEDDESSEESDDDAQVVRQNADTTGAWHSDSEDEGPRRTTGVGLRNPKKVEQMKRPVRQDSDSEEDLPLTVAIQRVQTRGPQQYADSDDDEDRPLAQVIREPKVKSSLLDINFDKQDSEDEDSQPLGLRASRMMLDRSANEDDDDKPLAFHPEQQRRTQYQMFAVAQQQQQQQQAIMMQAQYQSSMFFNQPMMTGPYFSPPMMGPPMNPMAMMQPPMPIPSPPPIHDQAKYMSVDRWRRDVAIDGES
ncbi:hypothetical protein H1R20_g5357, partial [Candolleomyces eurysporus]